MNIRLFIRLIYLIIIYYIFLNNYDTIKSLRKEVIKMHNNFELNETTGVGLIKDDNDNNILIKTDANEEQLTAILEKENEIENEQNKIDRIKKLINSYNDIMLTKKIFYFLSIIFFIFACDAFIDFNVMKCMYGFPSLAIVLVCPYLSIKLGTFKYNLNQRKKLEESIE